jgi:hypothetical protein
LPSLLPRPGPRIGELEVDQLRVRRLQVLERDDGS